MKREDPYLEHQALVSYVRSLYFYPEATSMPLEIGEALQFSDKEVQTQLSRMQKGKGADLQGFTVELLE